MGRLKPEQWLNGMPHEHVGVEPWQQHHVTYRAQLQDILHRHSALLQAFWTLNPVPQWMTAAFRHLLPRPSTTVQDCKTFFQQLNPGPQTPSCSQLKVEALPANRIVATLPLLTPLSALPLICSAHKRVVVACQQRRFENIHTPNPNRSTLSMFVDSKYNRAPSQNRSSSWQ